MHHFKNKNGGFGKIQSRRSRCEILEFVFDAADDLQVVVIASGSAPITPPVSQDAQHRVPAILIRSASYFSERSAGSLNSARMGALAGSPQGQTVSAAYWMSRRKPAISLILAFSDWKAAPVSPLPPLWVPKPALKSVSALCKSVTVAGLTPGSLSVTRVLPMASAVVTSGPWLLSMPAPMKYLSRFGSLAEVYLRLARFWMA